MYDEYGEEINQTCIDSPLKKHKDDASFTENLNSAESPVNSCKGLNTFKDRNSPQKSLESFGN